MLIGMLAAMAATVAGPQPAPQGVRASRVTGAIKLDGHLDEDDWTRAQSIEKFFEYYPGDRAPPTERTQVRILYDDRYLYVGFRLALRDRGKLRTPFVRRDKVGSSHDYVQIYLDPQNSRRGSYLFRVNARGTKTDGYQDEGQQTETLDPDYDWDVATSIDQGGWSAELRIPLSTLRISRSGPQDWAVIVTRGVPRDQNTQMATAPFPHDTTCFLCFASDVSFPDLRASQERLIATPSATVTDRRDREGSGRDDRLTLQPSLDAKWLPFDGAALDLTVNPDFSQVEADQALLTANQRFALSLPEKRPFFREGADLVTTTIPVIYTRSVAAPDYGLRFTSRGSAVEGTAFAARDGGRPAVIEPGLLSSSLVLPDFDSYDAFVRVRRNLAGGDVGGLASLKLNTDGSRNVVGGLDASHASSTDRFAGELFLSETRDPDRPDLSPSWTGGRFDGSALSLSWTHTAANIWLFRYQRFSPGFRSWLGYVPRVGYQDEHAEFQHPFYLPGKLVRLVGPYLIADALQAVGGPNGHERDVAAGLAVGGYKALTLDLSYHPATIVLDSAGAEHRTSYTAWSVSINPAARVPIIAFTGQTGRIVDYATGQVVPGTTIGLHAVVRPFDRFELDVRRDMNELHGLAGEPVHLDETVDQLTATYFLRAGFYGLVNVQDYRSRRRVPEPSLDHQLAASVQFNWEITRDFQAYWGIRSNLADTDVAGSRTSSREIYLKLSRTFRR